MLRVPKSYAHLKKRTPKNQDHEQLVRVTTLVPGRDYLFAVRWSHFLSLRPSWDQYGPQLSPQSPRDSPRPHFLSTFNGFGNHFLIFNMKIWKHTTKLFVLGIVSFAALLGKLIWKTIAIRMLSCKAREDISIHITYCLDCWCHLEPSLAIWSHLGQCRAIRGKLCAPRIMHVHFSWNNVQTTQWARRL